MRCRAPAQCQRWLGQESAGGAGWSRVVQDGAGAGTRGWMVGQRTGIGTGTVRVIVSK